MYLLFIYLTEDGDCQKWLIFIGQRCRGNEIIMSWERDLMSWERDIMSWERVNYVVGTRSNVVGTRSFVVGTR